MEYVWLYFVVINLMGLIMMGYDKRKARRDAWRIPERRLFTVAAIGGSLGVLYGMYWFRHKTKHRSFVWGIPAILTVQAGAAVLLFWGGSV